MVVGGGLVGTDAGHGPRCGGQAQVVFFLNKVDCAQLLKNPDALRRFLSQ